MQVARWLVVLGSYDCEIDHWLGLKHNNTNVLSRGPCCLCGMGDDCGTLNPCNILTREAAEKQRAEAPAGPPGEITSPPLSNG